MNKIFLSTFLATSLFLFSFRLAAETVQNNLGVWGSLSKGGNDFFEVGAKAKSTIKWEQDYKLQLKGETYYWRSYGYDGFRGKGELRFDQKFYPRLGYFLLSAGKTDQDKKLEIDLEESVGLSWEPIDGLFFENRTGYGYTAKTNQAKEELSWLAGHGLFFTTIIADVVELTLEGLYVYPLWNNRLKAYGQFDEGWIWSRAQISVPLHKYVKISSELQDFYYIHPVPGAKANDLYLRFGLDFWFP